MAIACSLSDLKVHLLNLNNAIFLDFRFYIELIKPVTLCVFLYVRFFLF